MSTKAAASAHDVYEQLKKKDIPRALTLIRDLKSRDEKASCLRKTFESVKCLQSCPQKDGLLACIAQEFLGIGSVEDASEVVRTIDDPDTIEVLAKSIEERLHERLDHLGI